MIWRKSWWECRFRIMLGALCSVLISALGLFMLSHGGGDKGPIVFWEGYATVLAGVAVPVMTLLMAGSGINSQTSWGMLHGFHPSMHFLLSLPVSRRRALFVRSAIGALFTAVFILLMTVTVSVIAKFRGVDIPSSLVLASVVFMMLGAFGFYGFSTFLTTLFDEFWAGVIGLALMGLVFGFGLALEQSPLNPVRVMAGSHYRQTGDVNWPVILLFALTGIAFISASVVVVERKEY